MSTTYVAKIVLGIRLEDALFKNPEDKDFITENYELGEVRYSDKQNILIRDLQETEEESYIEIDPYETSLEYSIKILSPAYADFKGILKNPCTDLKRMLVIESF